jgi:hypothetical protein
MLVVVGAEGQAAGLLQAYCSSCWGGWQLKHGSHSLHTTICTW